MTLALAGDAGAQRQLAARLLDVVHRVVVEAIGNADANAVATRVQEVFVALLERDAEALRRWDPEDGTTLDACIVPLAKRRIAKLVSRGPRAPSVASAASSEWTPLQGEAREAVLAKIVARLDQGETLAEHGDDDLRARELDAPREAPTQPDLPFPVRDERNAGWQPTTVHLVTTIVLAIAIASTIAIWAA